MKAVRHGRPEKPHNRIAAILAHLPHYQMDGQAKLARDTGLSPAAISRLLSGQTQPSFWAVLRITDAIERELGRSLDPRELVSLAGQYPTPYVCQLCSCPGCQPEQGGVRASEWSGDCQELTQSDLRPIEEWV